MNEEKNNEIEFSDALKNMYGSKMGPTPRNTLRLTDVLDRNSSSGGSRTRKRFDTLVKNKKLS